MRSLVFDPHLATLGGGERYAFAVARVLAGTGDVTIAGHRLPDPERLARLGFDAPGPIVAMTDDQFTTASREVDVAVVIASRLPPATFAARSVLVVQFPFPGSAIHHPTRWATRRRLLRRYDGIVYSDFVRSWLARRWKMEATVVPPPVAPASGSDREMTPSATTAPAGPRSRDQPSSTGHPVLLAVGRFFASEHHKRHDVLIQAFSELTRRRPDLGAELVLIGGAGSDARSRRYVGDLQRRAAGLDVSIEVDADQATLDAAYRRATLFWHAAGFERPRRCPERAEHFGMVVVEAMAYGVPPLVFDDGGLSELVDDDCGVRWRSVGALVDASIALLDDPARRACLADTARQYSSRFSPEVFQSRLQRVLFDAPARAVDGASQSASTGAHRATL
jgi:glycosyltransferase involved in cell wall biosynthesis